MEPDKAFHVIDNGSVKATIWHETSPSGEIRFNIAFTRRCHQEDRWWDSTSFQYGDMPGIARLAEYVHAWISEHSHGQSHAGGLDESSFPEGVTRPLRT